ncbi:sorting nexin-21 [Protobothrops mucrosquamatus]|uniref:sorting nexin-21 n=1 Tax=Protobothrops mucrosquamatus TaxID=103944 RepID=UPI0010FB4864|nr:sorting nexin-21 [Protobothrops mucrosquamatus]
MASRLLHRLRHALAGPGEAEGAAGGAEDCPESSELEDDTEGLATRLSGTLSFSSNEEEEEEEEEGGERGARLGGPGGKLGALLDLDLPGDAAEIAESDSPLAEQRGSHLLTRQLQELWQKSRGSLVPQRLLFEVTNASVVSERSSKHVLYTIYLIRAGQFDHMPAAVARCYSDFERLNRRLRRHFSRDMAGLSFPRKQLWHNFTPATIAKRSRAFEQFLSHLHASPEIRRSATFLEFFFLDSLQGAQRLTGKGLYPEALAAWVTSRRLQEKLGACRSGHYLLTLAGLTVCHQELEQWAEAYGACQQALQQLESQQSHPLLAALLQTHVHLAWGLGKDKQQAETRLRGLQEAREGKQPPPTLKELLLKQPLP